METASRGDSAVRKIAVRASAVENWISALRGPSAAGARWFFFAHFFLLFILSAVENLGPPHY